MDGYRHIIEWLGLIVVGGPLLLIPVLGIPALLSYPLSERFITRAGQTVVVAGLLASLGILGIMLTVHTNQVPIDIGNWVQIPHYHLFLKIEFDRLSVPFVILSFVLCGTIGAFAARYMHREPGFNRFHVLYSLFLAGMIITSTAGTIETLFTGWEMVGLSSALLVAFYHERPAPVRNGLWVWTVYRVSDAALLLASVVLHHASGEGNFDKFLGTASWPEGHTVLTEQQAFLVGLLILIAAIGKSALVPLSGWLPRAMEGPTPSSAVFYGALSVHLGAFLLLRVSPLLDQSRWLCAIVVLVGLTTAVFGAITARVQTDIKCALSFASVTQVGIIVAEIGLGFRYIALVHILGHACLRTLQFVRAPTLLLDYHNIENAIGARLGPNNSGSPNGLSEGWRMWLYRFALERGHLDSILMDYLVRPFLRVFETCDALEQRWTDWLSAGDSRQSEHARRTAAAPDDFL